MSNTININFTPGGFLSLVTADHRVLTANTNFVNWQNIEKLLNRTVSDLENYLAGSSDPEWFNELKKHVDSDLTPEVLDAVVIESPVVPEVLERAQDIALERDGTDFTSGMNLGFKDGKGHQKRKFSELDRPRVFKRWSKAYVEGYLTGYRTARSEPRATINNGW